MRDAWARGMHEVVPPFSGGTTFLLPGISRFFGLVIYMYANDHGPVKHFHAEYNGHWAKYSFDGDLIKGGLPRKQERLVLAWAEIHREDLESNWKCVEAHVQPGHIEPLR